MENRSWLHCQFCCIFGDTISTKRVLLGDRFVRLLRGCHCLLVRHVSAANTSGYLRHLDADADCRRFVTAVLYLNPSWPKENGGQLEVVTDAGTLQLLPEADKYGPRSMLSKIPASISCDERA
eukprot:GHVT01011007.1.p2 GENE.GHVT01011007.1~~GHVT01011007.1.p2  ORF type:complete len:123 (+),score=7.82 GHVT01011007.1:2107-2475(+)